MQDSGVVLRTKLVDVDVMQKAVLVTGEGAAKVEGAHMTEARCERDKGAGMMAAVDAEHMVLKLAVDSEDSEAVDGMVRGLGEAEDHMRVVDMEVDALEVEWEAEEEKHMCQEAWEVVPEDLVEEDHHKKVEDTG